MAWPKSWWSVLSLSETIITTSWPHPPPLAFQILTLVHISPRLTYPFLNMMIWIIGHLKQVYHQSSARRSFLHFITYYSNNPNTEGVQCARIRSTMVKRDTIHAFKEYKILWENNNKYGGGEVIIFCGSLTGVIWTIKL